MAIWDFMCRNKEKLKKTKVEVCGRRVKKDGVYEKNVLRTGNVHDLYFDGRSDQEAIQAMVLDRFFGLDCIGFTAGVLIYNGEWSEYKGGVPLQWAKWFCTEKVNSAKDIKPLDFMIWSGHIAMVDWVWKVSEHGKSVDVDVAQCSSGEETGPQYNTHALLTETSKVEDGHREFKFSDRGRPEAPVSGEFFIMRRKDFYLGEEGIAPIAPAPCDFGAVCRARVDRRQCQDDAAGRGALLTLRSRSSRAPHSRETPNASQTSALGCFVDRIQQTRIK